MTELKRWKVLDSLFAVNILLILFFAWMDSKQIITFHTLNSDVAWGLYDQFTGPAIWITWAVFLIVVGIIWYIVTKDKSEAIAISASALVLLASGLEDLFYFFFAGPMPAQMCWFTGTQTIISRLFGECCVTPFTLILNVALGVFISYKLYNHLKRAKW